MLRFAILLGLIGLIAATAIIVWSGYDQVLQALSIAGWGILVTSLFHIVPMILAIIGWRALMPGKKKPSHAYFLYLLWLRSSVNNLMPVARIGGEIVAVRVMTKHGIRKTTAIASTVVELTLSIIGVFLFDIIGISMFAVHVTDQHLIWQLMLGLLLSAPLIGVLLLIQRVGLFGLCDKIFTFLIRDKWKKFAGNVHKLDRAVHTMYRRYGRVLFCGLFEFMGWCLGAVEIWLALFYLDHTLSLEKAFMIEALIQASASAAFAVPGALGVQEAGFVLFGHMLGLTPDIAAALAVIRRCRDILLYVPGLIAWQVQEGHWLIKQRKA
jgi:putative membrane protein